MSNNLPSLKITSLPQSTVSASDLNLAVETLTRDLERPVSMSAPMEKQVLLAVYEATSIRPPLSSTEHALKAAMMLMGQYRNNQFQDVDVFAAALTTLFTEHPQEHVEQVAKELPRKLKWPPSIAEVCDALREKETLRLALRERAGAILTAETRKKQEAEREAQIAAMKGTPEQRKETVEKAMALFRGTAKTLEM